MRCEAPDCICVTKEKCHASCCLGETHLCDRHAHVAQVLLDGYGFSSGYFGKDHPVVLRMVEDLIQGKHS